MGWTKITKMIELQEITQSTNKNQIPARISKKGMDRYEAKIKSGESPAGDVTSSDGISSIGLCKPSLTYLLFLRLNS